MRIFTVRRALFVAAGTVTAVSTAHIFDEGTQRSLQFWSTIAPIYAHYRFIQLLNRDLRLMNDEKASIVYNKLHDRYTEPVRNLTYQMRGFYLKNAQIMSTQDDFVPKQYMRWVKDTQDNVPSEFQGTEAREYVREKMREESGMEFDEVFSEWDDTPLGVASIGEVHKARLRKTGEVVAVKFLLPGMESKFRADIATLRSFCKLAMPQHVSGFNEMEKQFCTEFDYRGEARNLLEMYDAIMPQWGNVVRIPYPHMDLCSKHILVMDYLEGVRLVDGIKSQYADIAKEAGTTLEELERERKEAIENGTFVFKTLADSHHERSWLLWYNTIKDYFYTDNLLRVAYNYSIFRLIYGPVEYKYTPVPIDLASTLELISNVHANQIFEHGTFNSDPHPGNILLLRDGRLGLLDYGQVKRMTPSERIIYAKLILAHSRNDTEEIVRIHFSEMGVITKKMDPKIAVLMSTFYNDRDSADIMHGHNMATFIDWLQEKDPMVRLPEEYLFASRVSLMMRGMAKAFGLQLKMSNLWKHEAKKFLESQDVEY